ncbi:unnamed protein product [Lampetra planeri]
MVNAAGRGVPNLGVRIHPSSSPTIDLIVPAQPGPFHESGKRVLTSTRDVTRLRGRRLRRRLRDPAPRLPRGSPGTCHAGYPSGSRRDPRRVAPPPLPPLLDGRRRRGEETVERRRGVTTSSPRARRQRLAESTRPRRLVSTRHRGRRVPAKRRAGAD